jgi:multidrug efflux system outer membrane protein
MKERSNVRTTLFPPLLAGAAIALALGGCAHIPDDAERVALPDFARAQHAASIHLARDGWPEARWWTSFGDDQLDALVTRALRDSPGLPVAAARLASARAALALERTGAGLAAGLEVGANRQRYSGNGLFPEPIGGNFYNDASIQFRAGYDFDWWGKQRALVAAALGETSARQAEYSQAERTIAAAVAQGYFRLQLLWARQDNALAMAALQKDVVAERAARVAHGLASIDEQRSAERDLGTLNEQAAAFATQAARETEALRALVGGGELGPLARRPVRAGVAGLPAQLGLDLLARRPDLQAARWRVEAVLGRVAASQAAYYPDINLAGSFGLDAVSLGRLLRPDSRTMLIGSVLQLPLFDSDRLDAQLGLARAERNQLIADYNEAVLHAVAEVAAEGATLQGIQREADAHAAAQQASVALAAAATRRMDRGLAERGAVLQASQAVLRQEEIRLRLQDASLQSEIALIKALGGGYRAAATTSTQQH